MLTRLVPVLALALALTSACAAPRATAPPAAPPRASLAAELTPLAFFAGHWDARVKGADSVSAIAWSVEPALGGRWLAGHARAEPAGIEARDYWTVRSNGEIVRLYLDSAGTAGEIRSPGWRGPALTLEGWFSDGGERLRVRENITRLGPDRFRAEWQAQIDGTWTTTSSEILVRRPVG